LVLAILKGSSGPGNIYFRHTDFIFAPQVDGNDLLGAPKEQRLGHGEVEPHQSIKGS